MSKFKIVGSYNKPTKDEEAAAKAPKVIVPIDRGAVSGLLVNIPNWKRS